MQERAEQAFLKYVEDCDQQDIRMKDIVGSSMSNFDARKYEIKFAENPAFRRAWDRNISKDFYMDLYERWDGAIERNRLMKLGGAPGSGKSWASLTFVAIARDWFGFEYKNFFSKMDASVEMITKAYEAEKGNNIALSRFYINIDEDQKTYGVGSGQEDTFFEGIMEFLRQRQINVNICNPFEYGGRTFDTQLEVVGYTHQGYMKIIEHSKIDNWDGTYRPLGYIVCKEPPKNYANAYKMEKDMFTKNYMKNLSTRANKDITILTLVYRDMTEETKALIRSSVLLGQERDTTQLIRYGSGQELEGLQLFNLPEKTVQNLVQSFKWRFFYKEMQQSYKKKAERIVDKGVKKGLLQEEWRDTLVPEESNKETIAKPKQKIEKTEKEEVSYKELIGKA